MNAGTRGFWMAAAAGMMLAAGAGAAEREGLGLSDAQKEQARTIRKETREKVLGVLDARQKEQIEKFRAEHPNARRRLRQARPADRRRGMRGIWGKLELTQAQKDQIAQIRKDGRQRFLGILDASQRDKIEANRKKRIENLEERLRRLKGE